jgi:hypothetical protein
LCLRLGQGGEVCPEFPLQGLEILDPADDLVELGGDQLLEPGT